MMHDMWHTKCHCRKIVGSLLWILAFFSFLFMWASVKSGEFWGYDPSFWWMNAIALGILAIPLNGHKRMGMCGGMGCMNACCKGMKDGMQVDGVMEKGK